MDLMGDDELDSYVDGMSLVGDDVLGGYDGNPYDVVGAAKAIAKAKRAGALARLGHQRPSWRQRLAPGVPVPDYGVYPVPLTPLTNNGTFTAAIANIEFRCVAQLPFRGERLLTRVTRAGGAATQVFAQNGVFIGTRPQQGVLGPLNLENYQANSFGVRFVMQQAEQGAELRVFAFVQPVLTGTDTLSLSVEILGRVAR